MSGIARYYKPEELVGKTLAMIVNLEPRKMMGYDSNGMILSVRDGDRYRVIEFDDSIRAGADVVRILNITKEMRFFDTHAHLDDRYAEENESTEDILARAAKAGSGAFLFPPIANVPVQRAIDICREYNAFRVLSSSAR